MDVRAVSITVVGGYLGAGKTTLLNHLLRAADSESLGVIVNDFGSINLDAELVVGVDGDLVELSNGCICCSMRDDLVEAVQRLLDRPDPPSRVIIEASGVSDPKSVAMAIERGPSRQWATIDAIVVVVDAQRHLGLSRRERIVEGGQITAADILVLNKVDCISEEDLAVVDRRIRKQSRSGRVVHARHGQVASELVLGIGAFDAAALADVEPMHVHLESVGSDAAPRAHAHAHGQDFWTWSFRTERPISARRLRKAIDTLPAEVVRAKGVVNLASHTKQQAVMHVVGRRAELCVGEPWGQQTPQTTVVLIGMGQPLDADHLHATLAACEVEPSEGGATAAVMRWVRALLP